MGRYKRAEDRIPNDILAAVRRCGLKAPLWYVGPVKRRDVKRQKTLADLVAEVSQPSEGE